VAERRARMRRLQRSIRNHDIFWWVDSFLRATFTRDLSDFPVPAPELPQAPDRPLTVSVS